MEKVMGRHHGTLEAQRAYAAEHREYYRAHSRAYRASHLEQFRRYRRRAAVKLRALINSLKDKPCTDCGIKFPLCAMQFDHRTDDKRFNIGAGANKSERLIREEAAKCDVVCANCHALRTHRRRGSK